MPISLVTRYEPSADRLAAAGSDATLPNKHLLGISFHGLLIDQVLERVTDFIRNGKKAHQICLANAYTVSLAWKDMELRQILTHADMVLADGMSIVWGGRWIGVDIPCRIAGPDLSESLCAYAETMGFRVFFLGTTMENLIQLKNVLLQKWPGLKIVGLHSPPMCEKLDAEGNQAIFDELRTAGPDILFVGMSTPKQEKWIASNLQSLQVPVCIGIGAAFDFMSGRIPRAPMLFQKAGMEWLYRLYREPRRLWKRYLLGNFIFLSHLGAGWLRFRFRSVK